MSRSLGPQQRRSTRRKRVRHRRRHANPAVKRGARPREAAREHRLPIRGRRGVVRAADAEALHGKVQRTSSWSLPRERREDRRRRRAAARRSHRHDRGPGRQRSSTPSRAATARECARPRAAQGARRRSTRSSRASSCTTTRCACSAAARAPRRRVRVLIESGDGSDIVGHGRRVAERDRRELAGARRLLRVQALQGRQREGKAPSARTMHRRATTKS